MNITKLNAAYLGVLKENLEKTLKANEKVYLALDVNPHVLQRADGSIYTASADLWTYDLSKAKIFYGDGQEPDGARLIPVSVARDRIVTRLLEQLKDMGDAAAGVEKRYMYHRRVV